MNAKQRSAIPDPGPVAPAERSKMRQEYAGRDPRVIRLLDQIDEYERRMSRRLQRNLSIDARLIRDVPRRSGE